MSEIARSERWILRRARFSDYGAVLAFHRDGTFEDLDYMPATYFTLLHDKNCHPFVATTLEGKVVSYIRQKFASVRFLSCLASVMIHANLKCCIYE